MDSRIIAVFGDIMTNISRAWLAHRPQLSVGELVVEFVDQIIYDTDGDLWLEVLVQLRVVGTDPRLAAERYPALEIWEDGSTPFTNHIATNWAERPEGAQFEVGHDRARTDATGAVDLVMSSLTNFLRDRCA